MASLFKQRHYEWLATTLHDELTQYEDVSQATIERIARRLSQDNPKFKSELFQRRAVNGRHSS